MNTIVGHALSLLRPARVQDRDELKRKTMCLIWHDQALMSEGAL